MTQQIFSLAEGAARAPEQLLAASVADSDDDTRATGLVLTKEQIKHIKRYELAGLALPTALADVIAYLGYENGAGKGLEATDFQSTFTLINGHARLWSPLRTDLLSVGDKLVMFAQKIQIYGKGITEVFDDIKALGIVEKYNITTLEDLRRVERELGDEFPGIEFSKQDETNRKDIGYFLDQILKHVKQQEADVNTIKFRLDAFGFLLETKIGPAIKLKLATIDNNSLGAEIKALQEKIDTRDKDIDEKNKEYKQLVKEAVGSITSGLIMIIYLSVQAEKIRKERDKLRKQQEVDIALMEKKNRILASLSRVRMDFQDLDLVVLDADIATKNLIYMWGSLSNFIATSSGEVDAIHDGLTLRRFKIQFEAVVNPWQNIEKNAYALLHVFAQADSEFRAEYGDQK
ncbi:alpha-xenorhabdolysin family binary toxin subunit A [Pseudomonas sp. NA-150]|uniref:alpha-xenorhabdolysin family binary toxin subunit A n=1 Tax=Pseudomonas sp. NA-150 TaxID=3367525 RepID=UPI0037CB3E5C